MKKLAIKVLCFLAGFALLFAGIQSVLHYRWRGKENLYSRDMEYASLPADSVDVLFFGTSEVYAAVLPAELYHDAGFGSYNFAISNKSGMAVYYQLLYALEYQTPKAVVCDFTALYPHSGLPEDGNEAILRKVTATLPDRKLSFRMICDICKLDATQSIFDWIFPLLRYHSMWDELEEANFEPDYVNDGSYPSYAKGCMMNCDSYEGDLYDTIPELWESDEDTRPFSEVDLYYYNLVIAECKNRGIEVVALMPPQIVNAGQWSGRWNAMSNYYDSQGVRYLNYNTYDDFTRLGLVLENDYFNNSHMNVRGAVKFSRVLGPELSQMLSLSDRRGTDSAGVWDTCWESFEENFADYIPD